MPRPEFRRRRHKRSGNIVVLTAFLLILLLAAVAFSVDVAYMQLVRGELRMTTDLAARAGTECILRTRDERLARTAALNIARTNRVAGAPLQLADSDVIFGRVLENDNGPFDFQIGVKPFNACQVNGARSAQSLSGPVKLFFGPVFGVKFFEPKFTSIVTRPVGKRDIAVVVDRSLSMNDPDSSGTKWNGLLSAFDVLLGKLDQTADREQVGLVTYSDFATIDAPLNTDLSKVRSALRRQVPFGLTNITAGIQVGLKVLDEARENEKVEKVMILMTDGRQTVGADPMSTVNDLRKAKVRLYVITFGFDADQEGMQRIAERTKSRYFHASNGKKLAEFFEEIGAEIDGLQYFQ